MLYAFTIYVLLSIWYIAWRSVAYLKNKEISHHCDIVVFTTFEGGYRSGTLEVIKSSKRLERFFGYKSLNDYWEETNEEPLQTPALAHRSTHNGLRVILNLARHWINTCLTSHPKCAASDSSFKGPTRLLDISNFPKNQTVRLVLSQDLEEPPRYLTLSYCWGGKSALTLNLSNLEHLRESISVLTVPLTIAQAIEVTHSLGFRYLWVDSLCIIQDSHEDFSKESVLMGKIYRQSSCTIAASAAAESTQGLLSRKSYLQFAPCQILDSGSSEIFVRECATFCTPDEICAQCIDTAPLNRRAWVVQERLLSVRTLHFGLHGVVFWECGTREAYDGRPDGTEIERAPDHPNDVAQKLLQGPREMPVGVPAGTILLRRLDLPRDAETQRAIPATPITTQDFFLLWQVLLKHYTRCHITVSTDRLPGITGIITEIQKSSGLAIYEGMWHRPLDTAAELLRTVDSHSSERPQYRAPSWSWVAVDGKISYPMEKSLHRYRTQAEILDFLAAKTERDQSGAIIYFEPGCLRLSGKLLPFTPADILDSRMIFKGDVRGYKELEFVGKEYFCLLVIRQIKTRIVFRDEEYQCAGLVLMRVKSRLRDRYQRIGWWKVKPVRLRTEGLGRRDAFGGYLSAYNGAVEYLIMEQSFGRLLLQDFDDCEEQNILIF